MPDAVNEGPKEYACNTPGGQVRLADLPLDLLDELEQSIKAPWYQLIRRPYQYASHASVIYDVCCRHAGVEPKKLTGRELPDIFELVPEDMPEVWQGGIPKAGGEQAPTSGSSGAPSSSDGTPTPPDS